MPVHEFLRSLCRRVLVSINPFPAREALGAHGGEWLVISIRSSRRASLSWHSNSLVGKGRRSEFPKAENQGTRGGGEVRSFTKAVDDFVSFDLLFCLFICFW